VIYGFKPWLEAFDNSIRKPVAAAVVFRLDLENPSGF
jgi:hypothetical protein